MLPQAPIDLRARANLVFCTDEKHIRTENTVTVNTKNRAADLCEIFDCARMRFSSAQYRDPAIAEGVN
jgi:hypothetical protein